MNECNVVEEVEEKASLQAGWRPALFVCELVSSRELALRYGLEEVLVAWCVCVSAFALC